MQMRTVVGAVVVLGMLVAPEALARPWHNITPGASSRDDVVKKFGSPDLEEGPTAQFHKRIVYNGNSVKESHGAAEAQFWFDKSNRVSKIYVTPAIDMTRTDVEAAWGNAYKEHRTDDFRLYLHYTTTGFVVFFERDGKTVYQFVYTAATGKPAPKEKKPMTKMSTPSKPKPTPRKLQRVEAKKDAPKKK